VGHIVEPGKVFVARFFVPFSEFKDVQDKYMHHVDQEDDEKEEKIEVVPSSNLINIIVKLSVRNC
jgi:hypothetical protein